MFATTGSRIVCSLVLLFLCLSWLGTGASDKDVVLVLRPASAQFDEANRGMLGHFEEEFEIVEVIVGKDTTIKNFTEKFYEVNPKAVVVMEDIDLYFDFQKAQPEGAKFPPCVVLMVSFAEDRIKKLKNATGILYEAQAATSLPAIRSLFPQKVEKVGVIYSSQLEHFFKLQKDKCADERIELVGKMVDEKKKNLYKQIKNGLKELRKKDVDAIWVFNDNPLLAFHKNSDLWGWGWDPGLDGFKGPVLVSVASLAGDQVPLGQFAVVPDHAELGKSAADIILDIQEGGWIIPAGQRIRQLYNYAKLYNQKGIKRKLKKVPMDMKVLEEEWEPLDPKSRR